MRRVHNRSAVLHTAVQPKSALTGNSAAAQHYTCRMANAVPRPPPRQRNPRPGVALAFGLCGCIPEDYATRGQPYRVRGTLRTIYDAKPASITHLDSCSAYDSKSATRPDTPSYDVSVVAIQEAAKNVFRPPALIKKTARRLLQSSALPWSNPPSSVAFHTCLIPPSMRYQFGPAHLYLIGSLETNLPKSTEYMRFL